MSIEALFSDFDRLMQSPASVHRLRRFILDLAVRGKLVPQDPADEPAAALLKRIAKEKARLVKAGEIRKPKKLPSIDDIPYSLPPSWRWIRIREITSDRGQRAPEAAFTYIDVTSIDKENGKVTGAKVLQVNEAPSRARKVVRKDDVVYSCVRPYLLNVAVVEKDFNPKPIASTAFAVLNGHGLVLPRYIWIVLRSPFVVARVEEDMRGQAYPAINDADFSMLPFPLPPLPEQHHIVAKVGELMGLCDRLEEAQTERETTRTHLTAASLARLSASEPDEVQFREHAAFALDNFTPLTTRPEQVKALRRTILNLAVQGKLVPQDGEDEPAAELLQRIAKEKTRLKKGGKIRKQKTIPPTTEGELPFALPTNWQWSRIAEVGLVSPRNEAADDVPVSFIPMPMIPAEYGAACSHETRQWGDIKKGYTHFAEGDVGLAKITPCFQNGKSVVFRNLTGGLGSGTTELHIVRPLFVDPDFILLFLKCPDFIDTGIPKMTGTAGQKRVPAEYFAHSPFPLPPLAEQRRIVAKVDKLMGLCDRLEESLEAGNDGRKLLADILLCEVISNVEVAPDGGSDKNRLENAV